MISKSFGGTSDSFSYIYDLNGKLGIIKDAVNETETRYFYDLAGRLSEISENRAGRLKTHTLYNYDEKNRLQGYKLKFSDIGSIDFSAEYGDASKGYDPGRVYGVSFNGEKRLGYTFDHLGRKTASSLLLSGGTKQTEYFYRNISDTQTTTRLSGLKLPDGTRYLYTYDISGNISQITKEKSGVSTTVSYTYDEIGQLIRENDESQNLTVVYSYDNGGNLTAKNIYPYTAGSITTEPLQTISYSYGGETAKWKDQLTNYNGQQITYDGIGNPLSYRGMSMTWHAGRQLSEITRNDTAISYKYNDSGIRTEKLANGVKTEYYIIGDSIAAEKRSDGVKIIYLTDESGVKIGFTISGSSADGTYYYIFNAQGDVIEIYNSAGEKVVEYSYDSWGKLLSVTGSLVDSIGEINPIRYRGYYYDAETGFYYLQSRYYDPEVGRFINTDGYVSTGQGILGNNMFAYCGNNPVNRTDSNGKFWFAVMLAASFIVAAIIEIGYSHTTESNRKNNQNADLIQEISTKNRIINDQNLSTGSNFTYGLYPVKHNGCEAIAVHNAKVLKKIDSTLSETLNDFQKENAMIGFGFFGSNPYAIGRVLESEGIQYYNVSSTSNMTLYGTYIMSYWTDTPFMSTIHTIAISYYADNYTAYNKSGYGSSLFNFNLDEYKNRFICGYYLP